MSCQTVSSRSPSECSVQWIQMCCSWLHGTRSSGSCGCMWRDELGSHWQGVCEPPKIQHPPFSITLVGTVSVGASCSPSVTAHSCDPRAQGSVRKETSGLEAQQKAGVTWVIWVVGLEQGYQVQWTSGRNKHWVLVSQHSSAVFLLF